MSCREQLCLDETAKRLLASIVKEHISESEIEISETTQTQTG